MTKNSPPTWQVVLVLVVGVLAIATSAIFVRLTSEAANQSGVAFSLFIAASRLLCAALLLIPAWRSFKPVPTQPAAYYYAAMAGFCLALHFAAWVTSLSFTSIAASTSLVTTNPVWVALISRFWFKEKLSRLTIIGIAIALLGGIGIALGDTDTINSGSNPLLGDGLALIGSWLVSAYLLLGREAQRKGLNTSSYITIAYSVAALVIMPFPLLFGISYTGYSSIVYGYIFLMAIVSQLIGHTSFNWSLRWLSPTLVTLAILFEPIGASILGFVIFGEIPGILVLVGAVVLLFGVAVAIVGNTKSA